ncbi:hypothetical protein H6787_01525 [Candidatus Nomurabacteria bacterium]|nr:hypothetical protein [Candidatus Nomurabacteria bacterium]
MFPAIISFVAMMGAAVITSKDVSYVRLETSDTTVEAGNQFSIDVFAYAHVPVNAVDVTLQFDSEAVEVLGVDRGQSVLTIWTRDPVIENGKVILQGGTYRKGFLKEHRIATINVRAKETGQSTFEATNVMLLAGDGAGSPVSVADSNNSVVNLYIYDENTSPDSIGVNVNVNLITDIDGDGKVTLKDISSFMAAWHQKNKLYDFNGDGRMTFKDFSIILANFFF